MSEAVEKPEFDDGVKTVRLGPRRVPIPDDWEAVPFEEAIELNPRYDKPDDGPFDFLPMDAVDEETQTVDYWTQREKDDCTTTWFKNGDTLYAKITPCTENGKITFINDLETEVGSGSTEFLVFHPKEGVTDERFVYYLANMPNFRAVTISLMEGSTGRQRVPSDVFAGGLHIPLPPLPEQRRIAEILSTVDEQIQQTDDMIEATKELKRGLMQNVLNINTTIENDESDSLNDASKESLGDLVEVISGIHVKSGHVTNDSSETPYLTGPADFDHRGFSVTKYTNKTSKFCEPGDTLVTVKGSGCGSSTFATEKAGISRQLKALRPRDSLDERYLYYYLQTKIELLSILAQGTSIPGLSTSDLTTLTIPLPKLGVQQQIGDVFATIDDQITAERERKQELKNLKRGLMQDLLTGQRRVDA